MFPLFVCSQVPVLSATNRIGRCGCWSQCRSSPTGSLDRWICLPAIWCNAADTRLLRPADSSSTAVVVAIISINISNMERSPPATLCRRLTRQVRRRMSSTEWAPFCSFTACPVRWWLSPCSTSLPTETFGSTIRSHRANQRRRSRRQCGHLCCAPSWSCSLASWHPDGPWGLACRPFGRVDLERRLDGPIRRPRSVTRRRSNRSCIRRVRTALHRIRRLCVRRTRWCRWPCCPNTVKSIRQRMCTENRGATGRRRSPLAWRATRRCCKR